MEDDDTDLSTPDDTGLRRQAGDPHRPATPALGRAAARGVLWGVMQTIGSRPIHLVGQVVLAWILTPDDFGLVALAFAVTAFARVVQRPGIQQVLVQRQGQWRRWANPAFWMTSTAGVAGGLLILLMALPAMQLDGGGVKLLGLMAVLALAQPFEALGTVPLVKLRIQLNFGRLAMIHWSCFVLNTIACILFACLKFGAYSFVLGELVSVLAKTAALWYAAPQKIRGRPQLRRWRYLMGDTGLMFVSMLFATLTFQADYIVLGLFHPAGVVGIYFFAFRLSNQPLKLIAGTFGGVVLPTLSKLEDDRPRQARAFLEAARTLALVAVPTCLLPAALADPVVRLIFESKWDGAIPVIQVLCLGMAGRCVFPVCNGMMQAQGRFAAHTLGAAVVAALFVSLVTVGAAFGDALSGALGVAGGAAVIVAIGAATAFILCGPLLAYMAIRPTGGGWVEVLSIFVGPLGLGVSATAFAIAIAARVPQMPNRTLLLISQMAAAAAVFTVVYVGGARMLMPQTWQRCGHRFRSALWKQIQSQAA